MMDRVIRDVDAATVSMSVVELNNMIIKLRKSVVYARSVVRKKLEKQAERYKKKKGTDEQVQENHRRANSLLQQIDILKKYNVDKITKFCLGLKSSLAEINREGTAEERVLARVAYQKLIKKNVSEWRAKHSDWELLSAYLNTQISRRHKNRKMAILKTQMILKHIDTEGKSKANDSEAESDEEDEEISDSDDRSKEVTVSKSKSSEEAGSPASSEDFKAATNLKQESDEEHSEEDSEVIEDDSDSDDKNSEAGDTESEEDDKEIDTDRDSEDDLELDTKKTENKPAKECSKKKKLDSFFLDGPFEEEDDNEKTSGSNIKGIHKLPFRTSTTGGQKKSFRNEAKGDQKKPFYNDSKGVQKRKQDSHRNNSPKNQKRMRYERPVKNSSISIKQTSNIGKKSETSNDNANAVTKSTAPKQESLHPSWAAKRKEKEHNFISFQSKRITFDD